MRVITIANQKGGCGKTTVAINLASSLAADGHRVLLVDLDPQGHCALGLGVQEEQIDLSIAEVMESRLDGEPLPLSRVTWRILPTLELAPSRPSLGALEAKVGAREGVDDLLRDLLRDHGERFDECVVDCPPHFGFLMRIGLLAADMVIVPVDTGYFSLHGLSRQLHTIEQLSRRFGRRPTVRILPNQYDVRTKLAREILGELRRQFAGLVFDSVVNFNTKIKEGASEGRPITEYAPQSMGAKDFQNLAREVSEGPPGRTLSAEILAHVERLAADAERLLATTTTLIDAGRRNGAPAASATDGASAAGERSGAVVVPVARAVEPSSVEALIHPARASGAEAPSHADIARRLDAIYGVQQEGEMVVFRSHLPHADEVHLAGDFNNWTPQATPMHRLANGDYEARLSLPQGRYRYRLVVDGRWTLDEHNPLVEPNDHGELASVVVKTL